MQRLRSHTALVALCLLLAFGNGILIIDIALAATNISSTASEHYAWGDIVGWIDFYNTNTVNVQSSQLTGYASSTFGYISLDCATSPSGNICGTSNYKVTNDGLGTLSGYAWNDVLGWISFSCLNHGCGVSTYGVAVSPSTGVFTNYAWSDIGGWISFNCSDVGICGISDYKVKTSWIATSTTGYVDSTTYDTGATGTQLVSALWQGSLPAGTEVRIQFASSNSSSGPWTYVGSDGTTATYYSGAPDTTFAVDYSAHHGYRYFRYRVTLVSNQAQTLTPRVDDVIINWSP